MAIFDKERNRLVYRYDAEKLWIEDRGERAEGARL
jgi:hypothetical protein